jgi:FAD/FMN-containing dehydrogenase
VRYKLYFAPVSDEEYVVSWRYLLRHVQHGPDNCDTRLEILLSHSPSIRLLILLLAEDSDLVCQPGIGYMDINDTLKEKGIPLFFPLDPAPGATIGGMLSTGCSGSTSQG